MKHKSTIVFIILGLLLVVSFAGYIYFLNSGGNSVEEDLDTEVDINVEYLEGIDNEEIGYGNVSEEFFDYRTYEDENIIFDYPENWEVHIQADDEKWGYEGVGYLRISNGNPNSYEKIEIINLFVTPMGFYSFYKYEPEDLILRYQSSGTDIDSYFSLKERLQVRNIESINQEIFFVLKDNVEEAEEFDLYIVNPLLDPINESGVTLNLEKPLLPVKTENGIKDENIVFISCNVEVEKDIDRCMEFVNRFFDSLELKDNLNHLDDEVGSENIAQELTTSKMLHGCEDSITTDSEYIYFEHPSDLIPNIEYGCRDLVGLDQKSFEGKMNLEILEGKGNFEINYYYPSDGYGITGTNEVELKDYTGNNFYRFETTNQNQNIEAFRYGNLTKSNDFCPEKCFTDSYIKSGLINVSINLNNNLTEIEKKEILEISDEIAKSIRLGKE